MSQFSIKWFLICDTLLYYSFTVQVQKFRAPNFSLRKTFVGGKLNT